MRGSYKSNGCGCEVGLLRYVRPPHARLFYAACVVHDDAYERGGAAADRRVADRQLLRDCVKIGCRQSRLYVVRAYYAVIALIYYVSVRLFGWKYFKWTNEK